MESWPLRAADPSDLEWMRVGDGKEVVWHMADPLRPDSLFSVTAATFAHMHAPLPTAGLAGVPAPLARLCDLHESSTAESNPFFAVVHAVFKLYSLPDNHVSPGRALSFWTHMPAQFKLLLQDKHPIALLILYLWYCRARLSVWWIELRARVECPAIILYLQYYHEDNASLQELLLGETPLAQNTGHIT